MCDLVQGCVYLLWLSRSCHYQDNSWCLLSLLLTFYETQLSLSVLYRRYLFLYIYVFAHIHLYTHYLWCTLTPTICFVECWKNCTFFCCFLRLWGLDWTNQTVFLGKPEKLIFRVPASVNIFKKKKRKSRALLKLLGEVGAEIFMTNVLKMFSLKNRRELL